jgi:hypothetical protein
MKDVKVLLDQVFTEEGTLRLGAHPARGEPMAAAIGRHSAERTVHAVLAQPDVPGLVGCVHASIAQVLRFEQPVTPCAGLRVAWGTGRLFRDPICALAPARVGGGHASA